MLRRAAQVSIHNQCAIPALRKGKGQVIERRRLSLAYPAADHSQRVGVWGLPVELNVRPHDAVTLRIRTIGGGVLKNGHITGNHGEYWNAKRRLNVLHGLDARVEILDQEGKSNPQCQADRDCDDHVLGHPRLGRKVGNLRFFPDGCRTLGHRALHRLGGIT